MIHSSNGLKEIIHNSIVRHLVWNVKFENGSENEIIWATIKDKNWYLNLNLYNELEIENKTKAFIWKYTHTSRQRKYR